MDLTIDCLGLLVFRQSWYWSEKDDMKDHLDFREYDRGMIVV